MTAERRDLAYVLKRFPRISETFIAAEVIELERQGADVTIFAISRPEEPFTHGFLEQLKARVVYLPHRPSRQPLRVGRGLAHCLRRSPGRWLRVAVSSYWPPRRWRRLWQATVLRYELDSAGIEHAHAHFATAATRLANLVWRMGGPPYSVTAHAKDIYHEDVNVEHLREKLGAALFVTTVSEANRRYLASVLNGQENVHVVPNAVDARRLRAAGERQPEPGLVVSVARLVEKKGLSDLVAACATLTARGVPVRLEIAGDGPLRAELEATAARDGVDVRFHGALPHEDVLPLYLRAAAFCLPCVVASTGDRDGLPTSVLEAMALGLPVVTTDVAGLAEAVTDGETGLLVPERDPLALADALERVLTEPELAQRLSEQGRRRVEESFSLERSVARLRTLFVEAA